MQNIDISAVKKNFRIIGNDNKLNEAVSIAVRVAPTDSTIVITGESGVGKECEGMCRSRWWTYH